ncbi:transcriptional regulator domain-containing protein [Sphingomonas sp. KC8]|nr:hypothetical protein KC8_15780 [Sphingomonas sp. KC8]
MVAARSPNPAAYAAVARFGRPALAWEVLRRDPAYRAAFSHLTGLPPHGVAADPAFVARWGLHFP